MQFGKKSIIKAAPQPVYNAAGSRGFYGEGYPYHRYLKSFGLNYGNSGFITKTITLNPIKGNLKSSWFPDCIKVYPWKKCVLNAVGLTNPGIANFCSMAQLKGIPDDAILSVASTFSEFSDVLIELKLLFNFFNLMKIDGECEELEKFSAIELNISCPNKNKSFILESNQFKQLLDICPLPIFLKINVNFPQEILLEIQDHANLAGITISNSLPWGDPKINWIGLFGTNISPLRHLGGGGLSGRPLLPLMLEYLSEIKQAGFEKFIMAGGGILSESDITNAFALGADAVQLGSVSLLRPWRVEKLIKFANI